MTGILLKNKILLAAEVALERQLTSKVREDYLKIVVAGLKTALNGGDNSPFAKMVRTTKDPIRDCVNGAISLCLQMRSASHGVMPMKAMIPAAMTLMLHALDLVDKAGVVKVGNPELVRATRMFTAEIFKQLGVSNEMLGTAAAKVHEVTRDPKNMEKLDYAAGTKAYPGAQVVKMPGGADGV